MGTRREGYQCRSIGETKEEIKKFGIDLLSIRLYQQAKRNPASIVTAGIYPVGGRPILNHF